jgi:hypothetical protein
MFPPGQEEAEDCPGTLATIYRPHMPARLDECVVRFALSSSTSAAPSFNEEAAANGIALQKNILAIGNGAANVIDGNAEGLIDQASRGQGI